MTVHVKNVSIENCRMFGGRFSSPRKDYESVCPCPYVHLLPVGAPKPAAPSPPEGLPGVGQTVEYFLSTQARRFSVLRFRSLFRSRTWIDVVTLAIVRATDVSRHENAHLERSSPPHTRNVRSPLAVTIS